MALISSLSSVIYRSLYFTFLLSYMSEFVLIKVNCVGTEMNKGLISDLFYLKLSPLVYSLYSFINSR